MPHLVYLSYHKTGYELSEVLRKATKSGMHLGKGVSSPTRNCLCEQLDCGEESTVVRWHAPELVPRQSPVPPCYVIVHMVRDPARWTLSFYDYHRQTPGPEKWIEEKPPKCALAQREHAAMVGLEGTLLAETLSACGRLIAQSGERSSLATHLHQLPELDGLRLMAFMNTLGSSPTGDLLRSAANAIALRRKTSSGGDRSSDGGYRRPQVLTFWMDTMVSEPEAAFAELGDFVIQMYDCSSISELAQYGQTRTASTFQWFLLCSVARLCELRKPAAQRREVVCNPSFQRVQAAQAGLPRVDKFHSLTDAMEELRSRGVGGTRRPVLFFQSFRSDCAHDRDGHGPMADGCGYDAARSVPTSLGPVVLNQTYEEFVRLGVAVIPLQYQPLFGLSEAETRSLVAHMRLWGTLRQCCGQQQSFDHKIALKGMKPSKAHHQAEDYDAPECDLYQLANVERAFLGTSLARAYPNGLWLQLGRGGCPLRPGYCERSNELLRNGSDQADAFAELCHERR